MTDRTWDIAVPADNLLISAVPDAIRDAKNEFATRLDIEHIATAATSASDDTDCGGIHKLGSARVYVQAAAPVYAPDSGSDTGEGTATLLTAVDQNADPIGLGRLWIDSDTDTLTYYNGSAWVQAKLGGGVGVGVSGDSVVLLAGRTGGQVICGGIATTEGLTFKANAIADATGTILFEGANTSAINFDSIPLSNVVLGANANANSKKITGLAAATTSGDALSLGMGAVITGAEVSVTGSIARGCWGNGIGSNSVTRTANVTFAPDFVMIMNSNGEGYPFVWMNGMGTGDAGYNKRFEDGDYVATTDLAIKVTDTTITFPPGIDGGNDADGSDTPYTFFYLALKLNLHVDAT